MGKHTDHEAKYGVRAAPNIAPGPLFAQDAPPLGEQLRDAAMDQVADNAGVAWMQDAVAAARGLSGEVTGEDVRLRCQAAGIEPHHHNAWGALTNELLRRGILEPTDRFVKMKDPRSHARMTRVYICRG